MGLLDRIKEFFGFGKKPAPPPPRPPPERRPSRVERIRERLRPARPRPPPPPREAKKTVEFKVNIGFYAFSTTYTTTRTMDEAENPKDYFSEVLREAEEFAEEQEPWLFKGKRPGSMHMEIGYEEI